VDSLLPRIQKNLKRLGYHILVFSLWTVLSVWTPAHAGKIVYSIQIGAFKELRYAINEQTKLKGSGRNVFYRHEEIENRGTLYRVYVNKYQERREAEREARRLKKLGLVKDYIIRTLSEWKKTPSNEVTKTANTTLVIWEMTLNKEEGGAETLMIHSNQSFWPSVLFSLEEEIPRLIININSTKAFIEKMPDAAFRGELIKGIRNQYIQDKNNLEIILDLAPGRKYKVTQVFDKKDNIFNLAVGLNQGKQ